MRLISKSETKSDISRSNERRIVACMSPTLALSIGSSAHPIESEVTVRGGFHVLFVAVRERFHESMSRKKYAASGTATDGANNDYTDGESAVAKDL